MAPEPEARVIAIDISGAYGTGVKGALVDASASLTAHKEALTPHTTEGLVDTLTTMAGRLAELSGREGVHPAAVGVAVPGLVDEAAGIVHRSPNLTLEEVRLASLIQDRVQMPVHLVHDTSAGALAENVLGVGRGVADMLLVVVGNGVGGAAISGGRTVRGAHGSAGEIGHIMVDPAGAVCGCGGRGCLETIASEPSLLRRYTMAAGEAITADELIRRAMAGHPAASRVWEDALRALTIAIASAVLVLDCELVVLHGPGQLPSAAVAPLRTLLAKRVNLVRPPRMEVGALGQDAGVLGAAAIAFERAGMAGVTRAWRGPQTAGAGTL
ncbi:MAG TPA: ROK family protein [Candidatus Binatia bacterium]|nr:ROK family protein [Candidatus Binatia bacterium]